MFGPPRAPGWPALLRDGDVLLRPYRRADADAWAGVRRDSEQWLAPWEPTPPGRWSTYNSTRAFHRLRRSHNRSAATGRSLPFAVVLADDGAERLVGQLIISNIVRRAFCSATVGYWVDHRAAGGGITPTALALAVDHAFGPGRLHRIEVNIRPENVASRRVVEKLRFREEAFHPRYLNIDGDWRDHIGYALTVEDVEPDGGLLARWHAVVAQRRQKSAGGVADQ
ncbi:GNAT family protein [Pilimelia columellifera]|uniref:GNAT family protein n=1 Tax=Pilimelia columellifera subsp. columellifera TaxID=706583 RepID=A0ABN3NFX1_9ACTN